MLNAEFEDPFLETTTNEKKALDVMKTAIEEISKTKKIRKIALFKPKKKKTETKSRDHLLLKNSKRAISKNKNRKLGKKFRRK